MLYADYSDPDVIRVGDDFWMVSSSFAHVPALPILHSKDLVNWSLVGHALPRIVPVEVFSTPRHGHGVWAPALRHHDGRFWIFYPDPDFGIYAITADDPRGPWSEPQLILGGKGLIDPCPLWDDDGRVYLVHAWARSRAGICNQLTLLRLAPDALSAEEDLGVIVQGDRLRNYTTLEGPKLFKRNGWYYVSAPAGGVATGWQSVFRSRSITGPYEDRIVLAQRGSSVNGPHQGAFVDTPSGQAWFLHFQDAGAYGRLVHLQPVVWREDWPVVGARPDERGTGEPVPRHQKPDTPPQQPAAPPCSDDFREGRPGLQWQWQANPRPGWHQPGSRAGSLRLAAQPVPEHDLAAAPHLLLQKFPAPEFSATTVLHAEGLGQGDCAGLVVFGSHYSWLGLRGTRGELIHVTRGGAHERGATRETVVSASMPQTVHLRVEVSAGALCRFSWSLDGRTFLPLQDVFQATPGRWVGAKVGLFAAAGDAPGGFAEFEGFAVAPLVR